MASYTLSGDGETLIIFEPENSLYESVTIHTYNLQNNVMEPIGQPLIIEDPSGYGTVQLNEDGTKFIHYHFSSQTLSQYQLINNNWELQLTSSNVQVTNGGFDISEDFSTIVGGGKVYDFTGTDWIQAETTGLAIGIWNTNDSYSINADGTIFLVFNSTYSNQAGAVRIFQKTNNSWSQMGDDIIGAEYLGNFGITSVLSNDGYSFVAGSRCYECIPYTGLVHMYEYVQQSWVLKGDPIQLEINNPVGYGWHFDITDDGQEILTVNNFTKLNNEVAGLFSRFYYNTGSWMEAPTYYTSSLGALASTSNGYISQFEKSGTVVYFVNELMQSSQTYRILVRKID